MGAVPAGGHLLSGIRGRPNEAPLRNHVKIRPSSVDPRDRFVLPPKPNTCLPQFIDVGVVVRHDVRRNTLMPNSDHNAAFVLRQRWKYLIPNPKLGQVERL